MCVAMQLDGDLRFSPPEFLNFTNFWKDQLSGKQESSAFVLAHPLRKVSLGLAAIFG